jgi:hypothetical protein
MHERPLGQVPAQVRPVLTFKWLSLIGLARALISCFRSRGVAAMRVRVRVCNRL